MSSLCVSRRVMEWFRPELELGPNGTTPGILLQSLLVAVHSQNGAFGSTGGRHGPRLFYVFNEYYHATK